ncbi:MAG: hypothetical protein WBB82_15855 [Limnothrix sp.]
MPASDEFKKALRSGDLPEAFVMAMGRATELNITTKVMKADGTISETYDPSQQLHTRLDLLNGTIDNEVGEEFIGTGKYRELQQFHQQQVALGNSKIQENFQSLQQLFRLLVTLQQYNRINNAEEPLDLTFLEVPSHSLPAEKVISSLRAQEEAILETVAGVSLKSPTETREKKVTVEPPHSSPVKAPVAKAEETTPEIEVEIAPKPAKKVAIAPPIPPLPRKPKASDDEEETLSFLDGFAALDLDDVSEPEMPLSEVEVDDWETPVEMSPAERLAQNTEEAYIPDLDDFDQDDLEDLLGDDDADVADTFAESEPRAIELEDDAGVDDTFAEPETNAFEIADEAPIVLEASADLAEMTHNELVIDTSDLSDLLDENGEIFDETDLESDDEEVATILEDQELHFDGVALEEMAATSGLATDFSSENIANHAALNPDETLEEPFADTTIIDDFDDDLGDLLEADTTEIALDPNLEIEADAVELDDDAAPDISEFVLPSTDLSASITATTELAIEAPALDAEPPEALAETLDILEATEPDLEGLDLDVEAIAPDLAAEELFADEPTELDADDDDDLDVSEFVLSEADLSASVAATTELAIEAPTLDTEPPEVLAEALEALEEAEPNLEALNTEAIAPALTEEADELASLEQIGDQSIPDEELLNLLGQNWQSHPDVAEITSLDDELDPDAAPAQLQPLSKEELATLENVEDIDWLASTLDDDWQPLDAGNDVDPFADLSLDLNSDAVDNSTDTEEDFGDLGQLGSVDDDWQPLDEEASFFSRATTANDDETLASLDLDLDSAETRDAPAVDDSESVTVSDLADEDEGDFGALQDIDDRSESTSEVVDDFAEIETDRAEPDNLDLDSKLDAEGDLTPLDTLDFSGEPDFDAPELSAVTETYLDLEPMLDDGEVFGANDNDTLAVAQTDEIQLDDEFEIPDFSTNDSETDEDDVFAALDLPVAELDLDQAEEESSTESFADEDDFDFADLDLDAEEQGDIDVGDLDAALLEDNENVFDSEAGEDSLDLDSSSEELELLGAEADFSADDLETDEDDVFAALDLPVAELNLEQAEEESSAESFTDEDDFDFADLDLDAEEQGDIDVTDLDVDPLEDNENVFGSEAGEDSLDLDLSSDELELLGAEADFETDLSDVLSEENAVTDDNFGELEQLPDPFAEPEENWLDDDMLEDESFSGLSLNDASSVSMDALNEQEQGEADFTDFDLDEGDIDPFASLTDNEASIDGLDDFDLSGLTDSETDALDLDLAMSDGETELFGTGVDDSDNDDLLSQEVLSSIQELDQSTAKLELTDASDDEALSNIDDFSMDDIGGDDFDLESLALESELELADFGDLEPATSGENLDFELGALNDGAIADLDSNESTDDDDNWVDLGLEDNEVEDGFTMPAPDDEESADPLDLDTDLDLDLSSDLLDFDLDVNTDSEDLSDISLMPNFDLDDETPDLETKDDWQDLDLAPTDASANDDDNWQDLETTTAPALDAGDVAHSKDEKSAQDDNWAIADLEGLGNFGDADLGEFGDFDLESLEMDDDADSDFSLFGDDDSDDDFSKALLESETSTLDL